MSRNSPPRSLLQEVIAPYAGEGWDVTVVATQAPGHAVELAREAAGGGADVVFACGGDGTINEVINGLVGTPAALGVLRGGMGDVFGREVGVSREPDKALRVLVEGDRRRFDLGRVNGRYFLMMAGVGFDANVVRVVPRQPKKLLGSTSYALWGAAVLARHRPRNVVLRIDGEEQETALYWMLLGNTRSYGGVMRIAGDARVDDGLLDAFIFDGRGINRVLGTATRILSRRLDGAPGVIFQRVREIEVVSAGLGIQIDGEYVGETPARFDVAPAAIDILLPQGQGSELFGAQKAESR